MRRTFRITSGKLIIGSAVFLTLFCNFRFFKNTTDSYPLVGNNIPFLCSLALVLACLTVAALSLICTRHTIKPVLIGLLAVSSIAAYFMDTYNIFIDRDMARNIMATDVNETLDLISLRLIVYFVFLGLLPSVLIYKTSIVRGTLVTELLQKTGRTVVSLMMIVCLLLIFSRFYTSFFRSNRELRFYANPIAWVAATAALIPITAFAHTGEITPVGTDAVKATDATGRRLIILVVGEAVRADRLSLNGYSRETTPLLEKEDIVSFTNLYSCGTSTVISVPCMFSSFGRKDFTRRKGDTTENLLDILARAGVHILWRDNNSSSKGVALRVPYEDFRHPDKNPACDDRGCHDEGMLSGLQEYIKNQKEGDILIILHQLGNHGPAYYKRYPHAFEIFTPVCRTNQVEECTVEEIGNAYDNCILYMDYFLSNVIGLLKRNAPEFETAMIYISDHGESLGENGIYLHGLPYAIAPDEQKHVASLMWFSDNFKINKADLRQKSSDALSHDYLFHTVLGLMRITTAAYNRDLDIVNKDRQFSLMTKW
ncbi:MAG: phosphoethanolamine--lipid A transferase [Thermodesulfobacteriota bacterium]